MARRVFDILEYSLKSTQIVVASRRAYVVKLRPPWPNPNPKMVDFEETATLSRLLLVSPDALNESWFEGFFVSLKIQIFQILSSSIL